MGFRDALGLGPETEMEVIPDGAAWKQFVDGDRSVELSDGLPILGKLEGVVLTDSNMRRLRDELQR